MDSVTGFGALSRKEPLRVDVSVGQQILVGFSVALRPENLLFSFLGVTLGTVIGVLPGIGPAGAIAILLSFTSTMNATTAIIMLAGVFYGSMYGGSTTSILVNIPGEVASIVTALDGYQMARKGRAGAALAIAAIGSFVAGTFGTVLLTLVAVPLASIALDFGPPEYFSLTILGLFAAAYLSGKSPLKGIAMVILGLMLSTVGIDLITGGERFTFHVMELYGGLDLVAILMGLFGVSEIMFLLETPVAVKLVHDVKFKMRELWPNRQELKDSVWPVARGSVLGFGLGMLPGGGPMIASFLSYALEKRVSRHPERFGTGAVQGVAGPESANNSAAVGAMVPLMVLGIPFSGIMAIMLGALVMHGLQPSPMLMSRQPEFFWGVVASMYIGNVMCLILNLPLVGLWARLLLIPQSKLIPLILFFCAIGVYGVNSRSFDLWVMIAVGLLGYLLRKAECPFAPLVLALVLGPRMETSLRQSLLMSLGDPFIFFTRPISGPLMVVALLILLAPGLRWIGASLSTSHRRSAPLK